MVRCLSYKICKQTSGLKSVIQSGLIKLNNLISEFFPWILLSKEINLQMYWQMSKISSEGIPRFSAWIQTCYNYSFLPEGWTSSLFITNFCAQLESIFSITYSPNKTWQLLSIWLMKLSLNIIALETSISTSSAAPRLLLECAGWCHDLSFPLFNF